MKLWPRKRSGSWNKTEMKLARFLTAGKSLVGIKDAEPRYRMGDVRSLPKFGGRKNPFRSSTTGSAVEEKVVGVCEEKTSPVEAVNKTDVCETQRRSETYGVLVKSASLRNTPREHTTTRKPSLRLPGIGNVLSSLKSKLAAFVTRIFAGAKRKAATSVRGVNPFRWKRSGASKNPVSPVQGELSLDKVKVIRNDLSDFDLDVVPGTERSRPQRGVTEAVVTAGAQLAVELEPLGK
jgi:hypothetical protein